MPELPEVEVTRRSFGERIAGARVTGLRLGQALRRGKYLWLPLSDGGAPHGGLLMHLGMSGSLAFSDAPAAPAKHDHFDLVSTRGTLRLTDHRRFGAVVWSPAMDQGLAGKLLSV